MKKVENKTTLYTIREGAKLVDGLSEKLIRKMVKDGKIKCVMAGKKALMTENALFSALGIETEK